jgi:Zn-dependent peptidase ImmA (M78 family)
MLKLQTSYSFSRIPYITQDALDSFAEQVIRDFAPETLAAPTQLDAERFIEYYLKMQIEYKRLSYTRQVLGMTAFNAGFLNVIDEYSGRPVKIAVSEGTVIIDPLLMQKRNAPRRRFTFMHEGAHWILHREAFAENNPFGSPGVFENQFLAAKAGRIDYSRSLKERNDNERIERQADFFASAMLMPKSTLRMAYRDFFRCFGEKPRRIVRGQSELDNLFAKQMPDYVARIFGVSRRAALIRLEKLNSVVGSPAPGCIY